MALQFIMGPPGSGKSHYLYEKVTKASLEHPETNYIVLVPEQFTMQTQKDLVMASPRKGIMNVDVLSFGRLAHRIFEETGGNQRKVLDDVGKSFVLRKIAGDCEAELRVLGSNLKKTGYIGEVKSVISEFTQYAIQEETLEQMTSTGNASQPSICFHKYADVSGATESYRYMIPLIRMSEIYLIAAECSDDFTESIAYINKVRNNRNCVNIELQSSDTEETIRQYITSEFMREVIGEGQLYFYYKRLAMEEILSGTEFSEERWTESMYLQYYEWPLPKIETDQRVN